MIKLTINKIAFHRRQTTHEQHTQRHTFWLLWPWPCLDDLDIRIWVIYS